MPRQEHYRVFVFFISANDNGDDDDVEVHGVHAMNRRRGKAIEKDECLPPALLSDCANQVHASVVKLKRKEHVVVAFSTSIRVGYILIDYPKELASPQGHNTFAWWFARPEATSA